MDSVRPFNDSCPGNLNNVPGYLLLTLINGLLRSKCNLGSKDNYQEDYSPNLKDGDEFDFIVIGSGSAGSVVANRLSENPNWRVLVLEAGGYPSATSDIPILLYSLQETEEDWQYKIEPSEKACLSFKDGRCRWTRGKVLGGSSTLNAMLFTKGNQRDYDQWAELGNTGWSWKDVKKHFAKIDESAICSHKYDAGDPIKNAIIKAYKQQGYRHHEKQSPEDPIGSIETTVCIKDGMRNNAAKAFLGNFKKRQNLLISLHSFVQKILIDPKTMTAYGVKIKIGSKILNLKSNKEIILSGGTINSAQLLMLSGIGPRTHLEDLGIYVAKDLPVGKYLQDHIMHYGFDISLSPNSMLPEHQYSRSHKSLGFINTRNDSIYPNIQYHHTLFPQNDALLLPTVCQGAGLKESIVKSKLDSLKSGNLLALYTTLLNPKSTGRITLKSKFPEDKPIIDAGYFTDEQDDDLHVMLEGIRFLEKLIESPEIQKFGAQIIQYEGLDCNEYKFRSEEYWKCSLRHLATTVYHPTSSCKMGPTDDGTSVVDPNLKVHGIKNLRVVDASIMPHVVSGNTHAPTMMIGHKAGDIISKDWLKREREEL
ncbi:unnamed protein product [Diabrotica balteata]|uniref:Glucose-methanol-choline oxidoreductase N-terminal domain-containing protein n=1 Tax=Diabrotica balteata TaxID=107213 RepID=A0A9N9SSB1_DIABA|nr:unnamed protein product [Diabrotica balteata]